ncbi:MAG: zinc ribbon domain-containing protein [Herpetosiphonaceae bacterium]|nr:MAG: zinc ribbon domain-containing protein [Herpetosiphonaceae bacterium]
MGFLDNLGKTISQGVDRAKFEAEKLQRTNRIKGEINDLQQQIETNLRQLGERAMELHRQGSLQAPEIGSLVQMIEQLQTQIAAKQSELTAVQNETFEQQAGARGQQAESQHQAQPGASTISCPTCGTALPAGAAFCGNCGARIQS